LWAPDGLFFAGNATEFLRRLRDFSREQKCMGVITRFRTTETWAACDETLRRELLAMPLVRTRETLLLDISADGNALFSKMRRSLREKIRAAQRRGVTVEQRTGQDVAEFWHMYRATAEARGFREYKDERFLRELVSAFACRQNPDVPVRLFWLTAVHDGSDLAHYIGGVAGEEALQIWSAATSVGLDLGAKKVLQWEAVLTAKALGARLYDFGGFDRRNTPGVFEFKRGFGGTPVRSSGLLFLSARAKPWLAGMTGGALREFTGAKVTDASTWDRDAGQWPGAHPLQCWAWGEARSSDSHAVARVAAYQAGRACGFMQVIVREQAGCKVGWVPGGPVLDPNTDSRLAILAMLRELRTMGLRLLVTQPYVPLGEGWPVPFAARPQTFWLDLTQPLESLEKNLHKEWRRGAGRFLREGGTVVEDASDNAVEDFIVQYEALVHRKAFERYGDEQFIRRVCGCFRRFNSDAAGAHIFKAMIAGKCAASAIVLRAGRTAHFSWGAFDYELRNTRANEGLQWGIIRHCRELGLLRYDLGGVDAKRNPGVFEFKRRMGGNLVQLPAKRLLMASFGLAGSGPDLT
jgi:hypothetical protein